MMQVNSDGSHTRVGGTSLGGATFLSLACIVTGCKTFPEGGRCVICNHSSAVTVVMYFYLSCVSLCLTTTVTHNHHNHNHN